MDTLKRTGVKFYSMLAFDDLTAWLEAGGYEKKNRILSALSKGNKEDVETYTDLYLEFLLELVGDDLEKAYECVKYAWTQASAVVTQNGLNDWTIYIINYKYYPFFENVTSTEEIFSICKQILLEYADALSIYNREKNYSPFINNICQYIRECLPNPMTISQIAKAHNFSESYISHCFKKETGKSIGKYILEEKIAIAKEMIDENVSFLEISNQLGFSSQSYFSRQFKKITGMTPNEYKNKESI